MSTAEVDLSLTYRRLCATTRAHTNYDQEDLVQEALARAVANGIPCDALPWLKTVSKRLAIDRARVTHEIAGGDSADIDSIGGTSSTGPEDTVISIEDRLAVRRALNSLPRKYREALLMYAHDQGPAAIAAHLRISPSATYTLLSRARARLKATLERSGFVPAVLAGRLGRWEQAITTGAVAVAMAVAGIAVTPHAEAPAHRSLAFTSASFAIERLDSPAVHSAPSVAAPNASKAIKVDKIPPIRQNTKTSAETCLPDTSDGTPAGVRTGFRDSGRDTVTKEVVAALPQEAKNVELDGGKCQ